MSKDLLRRLPLFSGLDEADLDRLFEMSPSIALRPGDVLVAEGAIAETAYVTLEGSFEVTKLTGKREVVIAQRKEGEIIGEIALLEEEGRRSATVRAVTDARVIEISRATFRELLRKCPDAPLAILRTVTARLRNTELMLRQSEKMAALGTLSAGLAHELNNPAAAVRRSADQLREAMDRLQRHSSELAELGLSTAQATIAPRGVISRLEFPPGDPLSDSDAEADLQEWLEEAGVEDPWELAPALLLMGWDPTALDEVTRRFDSRGRKAYASWLAANCTVSALLDELGQGAERISEIVVAVKSYAYLDQAPVQLLDIHEGLENTLIILRHKLKQGVKVVREYDRTLPRIEAYGSELNQVWTNILDNAIDAMQGQGVIRIRTFSDPENLSSDDVIVQITDDGPGIPPEMQGRIFEAFFTTKQPGAGTGLGMHIAYNIVVNQHRGEISLRSHPGETTFIVKLPVRLARTS